MEKRDSADPEPVGPPAAKRYSQRKKLLAERIADEKLLSSGLNSEGRTRLSSN